MTTNPGKAAWAARKAEGPDRQASELEADRSGTRFDWKRRQDGAAWLRREADRFRSMARRWAPEAA